jgi:LacI family transcriptional regulator
LGTQAAPRRITIADVALRANVSTAAVSKVLRNAYGVSPAMQARVRQAMTELGYRPHAAARGMRGQTYTIGMMLPEIRNPFFHEILEGVSEQLAPTDYQVLIGPGGSETESQVHITNAMIDRRMDGLILVAPLAPRRDLEETARSMPMVVIGRHDKSADFDTVTDDDIMGAGLVVDHLFELGHRRIAHVEHKVSGRNHPTTLPQSVRAEGYRQAMRRVGLPPTSSPRRTPRRAGTRPPANCSPATSARPPSSPAPTSPPSASSTRCTRPGCGCPTTSRSSATTTPRSRHSARSR